MSCARRSGKLAVDLEIERHRQLAADVVHGDVVHRERLVAGDHHDPLDHGLVVERARRGGDADLGAGQGGANGLGGMTLEQLHPVERQAAAHRQPRSRRTACRPTGRTRTRSTATTPLTFSAARVMVSAEPGGAVSVSVSMVRRPSRQPARHTKTATTSAAAASAHG